MDEIYELCDTCTIFRDGRKIASHPKLADVPRETLVAEMVGREICGHLRLQAARTRRSALLGRRTWKATR